MTGSVSIPLGGELANGKVFVVDESMADLRAYSWFLNGGSPGRYACRKTSPRERREGAPTMEYAHRVVARRLFGESVAGAIIDHINRDPLDNRSCNLRIADHGVNAQNARGSGKGASSFRGVALERDAVSRPWRTRIRVGGRKLSGGNHATPEDAARAYDRLALAHYGPDAWTNESAGMFTERAGRQ